MRYKVSIVLVDETITKNAERRGRGGRGWGGHTAGGDGSSPLPATGPALNMLKERGGFPTLASLAPWGRVRRGLASFPDTLTQAEAGKGRAGLGTPRLRGEAGCPVPAMAGGHPQDGEGL